MAASSGREFTFTDADFEEIRRLVFDHAGISLSDLKRDMVYARLARRVRKLGLRDFVAYRELVRDAQSDEFRNFVNALTTNLTSFFRESYQLDLLRDEVLPELLERKSDRRIRVWSAGCSTGQEPYSLAVVVNEVVPSDWDVKILATDLDTNVLDHARRGVYELEKLDGVASERRRRWFWKGKGSNAGFARAAPELQRLITFRQLNLIESWRFRNPFDVIFCRNVIIYFDKPTRAQLFERFADALTDDGYLMLGHSETMTGETERFEFSGRNVYRKRR